MLVRGEALDKDTVVCTRLVTDVSEGRWRVSVSGSAAGHVIDTLTCHWHRQLLPTLTCTNQCHYYRYSPGRHIWRIVSVV
jgi:hypothetical protein